MNLYTVFRNDETEEPCPQEIIVVANSSSEALQIGVKEFNLSEEKLDFYNLTDYANSQVKPQTLVHYIALAKKSMI